MIQITGGQLHRRKLKWPRTQSIRPTSTKIREAIFQIMPDLEGCVFLDLFAGSGAMGFEALSRGASEVYFVEKQGRALKCIKENLNLFGLKAQVRGQSALEFVRRYKGPAVDVIYADPPYESPVYEPLFKLLDQPQDWIQPHTQIWIEHRKHLTLPTEGQVLSQVECREYGDTHVTRYQVNHV